MSGKIMDGIKVVEMSTYIAGPTCARILGDWGADVIKVEGYRGDPVRVLGMNMMAPTEDEENPAFFVANSNKRIIALNQRSDEGKNIMKKLVDEADVFITNYRQDALESMGLDYETLKKTNEKLIFAHVLGFGPEGPDSNRPAFDFTTYFARSGFMNVMADSEGPPTINAPGFGDIQLGTYLAGGISAALYNREKSGQGEYVNVSLYHCGIFNFSVPLSAEPYATMYPYTRSHPLTPLVNTYKCSDGEWYYLGTPDYITYFARACRALGLEEMAENEDYSSIMGMLMNVEDIVKIFDEIFIQKPSTEWKKIFDEADIPGEIVCRWKDVLSDEQAYANTFLKRLNYTNGNTGVLPTTPIRFGSMDIHDYDHLPGGVGCDTVEILKEIGIGKEDADKLKASKAVFFKE